MKVLRHRGKQRASLPLRGILLGLLTALLGIVLTLFPQIADLEQNMELDWLYKLRGPRAAPSDVVVVSIDQESSKRFDLPNVPRKWRRDLHAKLVTALARSRVRVSWPTTLKTYPTKATWFMVFAYPPMRKGIQPCPKTCHPNGCRQYSTAIIKVCSVRCVDTRVSFPMWWVMK